MTVGLVGWLVLFGLLAGWEALATARGFPRLGRVFGYAMSYRLGRWFLFGCWIWLGWHFFIRGWTFFLHH
jgi:hypothetical protein